MKEYSKTISKYSISLKKDYKEFFINLVNIYGSFENLLKFLLDKYEPRIIALANLKKRSRNLYQPRGETYTTISFYLHKESIWDSFKSLSYTTKLSISLIIRLMIEWEINEERYNEVIETMKKIKIYLTSEILNVRVERETKIVSISFEKRVFQEENSFETKYASTRRPP